MNVGDLLWIAVDGHVEPYQVAVRAIVVAEFQVSWGQWLKDDDQGVTWCYNRPEDLAAFQVTVALSR